MSLSQHIAEHVVGMKAAAIPAEAIAAIKRLMLDTLGVAWAGSGAPGIPESREVVLGEGGTPESVVWGFGDRVPATAAAFLNSASAAALDYDSVHPKGQMHAEIVALPSALALAQRQRRDGFAPA